MGNIEYSWLQISDLHIFDNTEWNIIQEAYKKLPGMETVRFIVVTGDLHQFGKSYERTSTFLEKLLNLFSLSKRDIFIIPGNHDCGECKDKKLYTCFIDSNIDTNQDCYFEWFTEGRLVDCFQDYRHFIQQFYQEIWKEMYPEPEQVSVLQWNGKLNIIHLNSAIICDGDNSRKQLIDIHRLSNLPDTMNRDLPSIVLAHHAFDNLHDHHQSALVRFISDWPISAYLCGDLHRERLFLIPTYMDSNSSIPCIVCGKASPDYQDTYSDLGCILYHKIEQSPEVTVLPYMWNPKQKRFDSYSGFNTDKGPFTFSLMPGKDDSKPRGEKSASTDADENQHVSIWLPDAETAQGRQTRFGTFTATGIISKYISPDTAVWGVSAVKGIGKTFVLQVKRTKAPPGELRLPLGVVPSPDNNWATDSIVFGHTSDLTSLKKYDNIVSMWKYSILTYTVNQLINVGVSVSRKWWDCPDPSACLLKKVEGLYKDGSIGKSTYSFCTDDSYMSLDTIVTNLIDTKGWTRIIGREWNKLLLLRRGILDSLHNLSKESVVLYIDKVDQALKQTSAEPPGDCVFCHKKGQRETCANPKKDTEYCVNPQTECNEYCCYGCENFATAYSFQGLRIYAGAGKRYLHINLWQHLQLGLLDAVHQLKAEYQGAIKIYFTIRQEAFSCEEWIFGEHRKKVMNLTEVLWYSKEDQRKIFYDCIRNQEDEFLFNPSLKDDPTRLEEAFVGVDSLCHPYARHLTEHVFDSIYRHSFDRTRDIQEYGQMLTNNMDSIRGCESALKRGELVKDLIEKMAAKLAFSHSTANTSSNGCYYYEKIKLLPNYWTNPENFKRLILKIEKNLLFYDELVDICRAINGKEECSGCHSDECCIHHPFSMLYKLGMLGQMHVNYSNNEDISQKFLHSKEVTYFRGEDIININDQSLYIVHPALTKSIELVKNQHIKHFQGFILGKDCTVHRNDLEKLLLDHGKLSKDEFDQKYFYQVPN